MADTFKGIITADGKKRQLPYRNLLEIPISDKTLSVDGGFADSKAVGDKFAEVEGETNSLKETLADISEFAKPVNVVKSASISKGTLSVLPKEAVEVGHTYAVCLSGNNTGRLIIISNGTPYEYVFFDNHIAILKIEHSGTLCIVINTGVAAYNGDIAVFDVTDNEVLEQFIINNKYNSVNAVYKGILRDTMDDVSDLNEALTAVESTKADKTALAKTSRSLSALWKLNQGISYEFEEDSEVAYEKDVPSGAKLASLGMLGGRTIVWNQLANFDEFVAAPASNTISKTESGFVHTTAGSGAVTSRVQLTNKLTSSHKYFVTAEVTCPHDLPATDYGFSIRTNSEKIHFHIEANKKTNVQAICSNASDLRIWFNDSCTEDNDHGHTDIFAEGDKTIFDNVQLFDLTAMFGSGNEPSTPEEFEAMFPADYYEYDAGSLMSVGVNEVVEQGKNLWDEQFLARKYINTTNGNILDDSTRFIPANFIPVEPNSKYYVYSETSNLCIIFYDKDMNAVPLGSFWVYKSSSVNLTQTFETPAECYYIKFYTLNYPSYKNDICISKGETPVTYAPYRHNSYSIPQEILDLDGYGDSAGSIYNYVDFEEKKYHKRVGKINLGNVPWYSVDNVENIFYIPLNKAKALATNTNDANLICSKYPRSITGKSANTCDDKSWQYGGTFFGPNAFTVKDTSYTTTTAIKAAMEGAVVYYELATEEVTDISDILDSMSWDSFEVESGGTVTLKSALGDDYRVPVPSKEQYVISLKEVGSNE